MKFLQLRAGISVVLARTAVTFAQICGDPATVEIISGSGEWSYMEGNACFGPPTVVRGSFACDDFANFRDGVRIPTRIGIAYSGHEDYCTHSYPPCAGWENCSNANGETAIHCIFRIATRGTLIIRDAGVCQGWDEYFMWRHRFSWELTSSTGSATEGGLLMDCACGTYGNCRFCQCGLEPVGKAFAVEPGIYEILASSSYSLNWGGMVGSFGAPGAATLDIRFSPKPVIRVPTDYVTIQEAINAVPATGGWTIEVAPGTYGAIDFKGKSVTVKAIGSQGSTIIDGSVWTLGSPSTSAVRAVSGEGSSTVLEGFTILRGGDMLDGPLGGGIRIENSSPTVRNCAFVYNMAEAGGGLAAINSYSLIDGCVFTNNRAGAGGGLWFQGGRPQVSNCIITSNTSFSASGGGLFAVTDLDQLPNVSLVGNTICGNTSHDPGRMNTWALFADGGNSICDCISDIDSNRVTDFADVAMLLLTVGEATDPNFIQPDQDMNGFLDMSDVALLLLNFGDCQ